MKQLFCQSCFKYHDEEVFGDLTGVKPHKRVCLAAMEKIKSLKYNPTQNTRKHKSAEYNYVSGKTKFMEKL